MLKPGSIVRTRKIENHYDVPSKENRKKCSGVYVLKNDYKVRDKIPKARRPEDKNVFVAVHLGYEPMCRDQIPEGAEDYFDYELRLNTLGYLSLEDLKDCLTERQFKKVEKKWREKMIRFGEAFKNLPEEDDEEEEPEDDE